MGSEKEEIYICIFIFIFGLQIEGVITFQNGDVVKYCQGLTQSSHGCRIVYDMSSSGSNAQRSWMLRRVKAGARKTGHGRDEGVGDKDI